MSLYKTEKEIRDEFDAQFKGPAGGGANWYTDRVREGTKYDDDGNIVREGWAWLTQVPVWPMGHSEGFAEGAAERNKAVKQAQYIERKVRESGLTQEQIKKKANGGQLTYENVDGIVAEAQRGRAEQQTPQQKKDSDHRTQVQKDANTIAEQTLEVTKDQNRNEMQLATNQMELARLDNKFDRETASADRLLTLQLAQMDSDLADKRLAYDRETRSMDKRDQMIAQLVASLGSLGGAFAL